MGFGGSFGIKLDVGLRSETACCDCENFRSSPVAFSCEFSICHLDLSPSSIVWFFRGDHFFVAGTDPFEMPTRKIDSVISGVPPSDKSTPRKRVKTGAQEIHAKLGSTLVWSADALGYAGL